MAPAREAQTVFRPGGTSPRTGKGFVEPGKAADLCVLDRPLPGLDRHALTETEVDLTVFDGRIVDER